MELMKCMAKAGLLKGATEKAKDKYKDAYAKQLKEQQMGAK